MQQVAVIMKKPKLPRAKRPSIRVPKAVFFLLPFIALAGALLFLRKPPEKKEQPSFTPRAHVNAGISQEVILKRVRALEEKLKKKPKDVALLDELASLYSQLNNLPAAYFLYNRVLQIAPHSHEGKRARAWMDQRFTQAKRVWFQGMGQRFQQVTQVGYENLTVQLTGITQKVQKKQQQVLKEREAIEEEAEQKKAKAAAKKKEKEQEQQPGIYILTPVTQTSTTQ